MRAHEENVYKKIAIILNHQELNTLSMLFRHSTDDKNKVLCDTIMTYCDIDVRDLSKLRTLSEEEIGVLRKYETKHYNELIREIAKNLQYQVDTVTETTMKHSNGRSMLLVYWFGISLAFTAVIYMILLTWLPIPNQNIRFADTSLGFILGSVLSTIVQYFFGNSMVKTDYHSTSNSNSRRTTEPPTVDLINGEKTTKKTNT